MRPVIKKPPAMLTVLIATEAAAAIATGATGTTPPDMSVRPPSAVVPLMAFVTDISGECSAGLTPDTTK